MIQEDEVLVCNLVYTLLKYFQAFLPTHSFCANHVHLVPILYLSFCTTHPIGSGFRVPKCGTYADFSTRGWVLFGQISF